MQGQYVESSLNEPETTVWIPDLLTLGSSRDLHLPLSTSSIYANHQGLIHFSLTHHTRYIMRPNFSEFSYGYALTEALVDGRQHLVRPIFPTQVEEGNLGYDLRFDCPGYPLFLQFKLCDGMKTRAAKELSKHELPLRPTFLRMNLMPTRRSKQHSLLLKLKKEGEVVFYAAPRFYEDNEFASHYRNREIISHTAFISPDKIGPLPDEKDHHVAFECMARKGWLVSDPREVAPILDGNEFNKLNHRHLDNDAPLAKRIRMALANVFNVIQGSFDDPITIRNLLVDLRQWHPEYLDADDMRDSSEIIRQESLFHLKTKLRNFFAYILQDMKQSSETGEHIVKNVNLLTNLTQLYFETTLLLMTDCSAST